MKKTVSFDKKIDFPTMIGEITEVSLDHNLKFINESSIEGDLLLVGKYKLTEASTLEEDFNYSIPVEISLTESIDLNTSNIEIGDFYYELENDKVMNCHIELLVEGLELLEEVRECDGEIEEKEVEIPVIENVEENNEESLFVNLKDDSDTYGTFIVYMVRQNESINSILEKYHTAIEELQKYNDINNINIGTKLIIPYSND